MFSKQDIDVVARTIYGEARGEYLKKNGGVSSLIAVACVIRNRIEQRNKSPAEICLEPYQFSCWNNNDPNRKKILAVDEKDYVFRKCKEIAEKVINGNMPDLTCGANHYYSSTLPRPPYWAKSMIQTFEVGSHMFFKSSRG